MLIYLSPILAIFVFIVAIFPLKINRWWKLIIFGILFCISQKYFILYLFGGPVFFAPRLPRGVMLFSAWIYAVLIAWFALLLVSVIARIITRLIYRRKKKEMPANWKTWVCKANFILLGIAILCTTLGIYWGTALPEVRERTICLKDLPKDAEGMRIALISDLHIDYITQPEFIREIVRRTNAAKPDLIAIVGDFVDGTVELCGNKVGLLKDLKAPYGVWGVPGNHEYYSGYHQWMYFLERETGINMLLNDSVRLPNGIYLSGTTDQGAKRFWEEMPNPEMAKHPEMKPEDCGILLAHNPKLAHKAKSFYDLQFSGHTHGGMILGMDLLVRQMNGGFVSGLYNVGNMQLYLTNGTCIWSGFPIRFGRPSEIALITLKKK